MKATPRSEWLKAGGGPPGRVRLFCFPHAGGGASIYRQWSGFLAPAVEVCPVQLPGREDRLRDPPFVRLQRMVEVLAETLQSYFDMPFAFFGHSMGGLIAFELVRELRRTSGNIPVHLFVSAHRAPQLPDPDPPIHALPDELFMSAVERLHTGRSEAMQHPELRRLLLPTLRADFAVCETYDYRPEPPLDCSLTVFGGKADPRVPLDALGPWAEQTRRVFVVQTFPGDHFYLWSVRDQLLHALAVQLTGSIEAWGPQAPHHV